MSKPSGVTVEIGGKDRTLRFTMGAMYKLERDTGKGFIETVQDLHNKASYMAFVNIVWCALLHDEPRLKPDGVADLLDPTDFKRLTPTLLEAMKQIGLGGDDETEGNSEAASESGETE